MESYLAYRVAALALARSMMEDGMPPEDAGIVALHRALGEFRLAVTPRLQSQRFPRVRGSAYERRRNFQVFVSDFPAITETER
jgi:hypothetical protein